MNRDRWISSTIMITLTVGALLNRWVLLFVTLALTIGAMYEFFHRIKKKGIPIYSYTGIVIGVIIPLVAFFQLEPARKWDLLFIAAALLVIFVMQLSRNDNTNAIVGISCTLFGVLYVSWFFSFLIKIYYLMPEVPNAGVKMLAFLLLVTKCGDMGALLVGSKYGKKLLVPKISPKKTVEGAMGSTAASVMAALIGCQLIPVQLDLSLWHIALMGAVFGGLGQLGDMSESMIKRDLGVKDSGKMLPALGGALDAIDSLLFSAPVFYFYIISLI